jgi:phosphoribosyl 1,2-cyclic phosphodiesterase
MTPLFITSLNSGSNGNCYYVGNEREAVLIDAGLSRHQTELRMQRLGLSMQTVKAIFISHEHGDHIRGLPQLAAKNQLPVYITTPTLTRANLPTGKFPVHILRTGEAVQIGDLCVTPFSKQHDAADPLSFRVGCGDTQVGVFTDIGLVCDNVIAHFQQCHAVFLEANYDEDLLEHGRYPAFLKNRIRGGQGHLSNRQALELFQTHRPDFMSYVLLAHLSEHNNSPQVAHDLFAPCMGSTKLVVASRHAETPIYRVN